MSRHNRMSPFSLKTRTIGEIQTLGPFTGSIISRLGALSLHTITFKNWSEA